MALRTFKIAQRAHESAQRRTAERHPDVAALLARFPGAEVVAVREARQEHDDDGR